MTMEISNGKRVFNPTISSGKELNNYRMLLCLEVAKNGGYDISILPEM